MLNSISAPKKEDDLSDSGEAPRNSTPASQIKVTLYNRSRKDKKVLAYAYFKPGDTPAGFLPEFSEVDMSSKSTLPPSKKGKTKGGRPPYTFTTSSSSSTPRPTIPLVIAPSRPERSHGVVGAPQAPRRAGRRHPEFIPLRLSGSLVFESQSLLPQCSTTCSPGARISNFWALTACHVIGKSWKNAEINEVWPGLSRRRPLTARSGSEHLAASVSVSSPPSIGVARKMVIHGLCG